MTAAPAASAGLPRLEKYELLEEIGHGGMATVYRARDPRLGREVAVKVIHRHLRENAEVGTRFVAEARAAAKLRHPAIVDVFDVSNEEDAERFLVVELVRGTTLRKVLLAHRDMPAEVGAAIVQHLCDAVEHAHASAIIHRDIKPENVLVELPRDRASVEPCSTPPPVDAPRQARSEETTTAEPASGLRAPSSSPDSGETQSSARDLVVPESIRSQKGRSSQRAPLTPRPRPVDAGVVIKITDFGIAKILDAQGVTSTGQVLGSPAHMAPEQIEGGDVDPRTDVFALGVLLYECLVGHLPFEGKNPAQVLRRVLEGSYPAPDRERPTVGGRWARIIAQALAKEPAERVASAAQLAELIRAELEALGVTDARAEIAAYFADPEGYKAAHKARLVPRLVARGEAARKAGDVWGAAADYNRALALAPDDLAILKRLSGLNSSAGRRMLLRRAGAILAGSAVLGFGAFAVARAVKGSGPTGEPRDRGATPTAVVHATAIPPAPDESGTADAPEHAPNVPVASVSKPIEHAPRARIPATPTATLAPPIAARRKVRISIVPAGARLELDGLERSWPWPVFELAPGPHAIVALPNDPVCCKRLDHTITVEPPPPGDPDDVQPVPLALPLNPTSVTLAVNAPRGATLSCPRIVEAGMGAPGTTTLPRPEWTGTCFLKAPDRPARPISLTLRAGQNTTVPWPD